MGTVAGMGVALNPNEIYERSAREGERRLSMPALEQTATGFIAGVTIVFGIIALGIVESLVRPGFGSEAAHLAGALAFGVGLVFVVVGRTELFTENFFDPVARAIDRRSAGAWLSLGRLWAIVLVLNLVGGIVMAIIFTVPGALPTGAQEALASLAGDIEGKSALATFARGIAAGTLITLLSYLLNATNSVGSRIALAYMVGVFLALGPFDHVIVSVLQLLLGMWFGEQITYGDAAVNFGASGAGNLVGGILLMTLTHVVQEIGTKKSSPAN